MATRSTKRLSIDPALVALVLILAVSAITAAALALSRPASLVPSTPPIPIESVLPTATPAGQPASPASTSAPLIAPQASAQPTSPGQSIPTASPMTTLAPAGSFPPDPGKPRDYEIEHPGRGVPIGD
jgi:hypothetical protein